jgi:hypothetical protein
VIRKIEETQSDQEQKQKAQKIGAQSFCSFFSENGVGRKIPGKSVGEEHRQKEAEDIHPEKVPSKYAGVGVEKDHKKGHACKNGQSFCKKKTRKETSKTDIFKNREKEDRKKQKFQMLPGRFIDRGKESHKNILS